MSKFCFLIVSGILLCLSLKAQHKAVMKIVSAVHCKDSIFVDYEIINESSTSFSCYRMNVTDVEAGLINFWLVSATNKENSKHHIVSLSELSKLTVF